MRKILLLYVLLSVLPSMCAQECMTVMFYNTENLFDTDDDPEKDDDDYTPEGDFHWTRKRYFNKLDAVSKVIVAADEDNAPGLVGLCEVENETVMTDLTSRSALRAAGYRYVMTDSPDLRGIDVALLYRRTCFQYISHESLGVSLVPLKNTPTRDVLHVMGRIASGDTLDIYVCHWPSRIGGVEQTEPLRMRAASMVRRSVDDVFAERRKPYVIIMGDLNDGPGAQALTDGLGTKPYREAVSLDDRNLVSVMDGLTDGSYRYEGYWDQYDQFVVSASLLNGLGCTEIKSARVFDFDFLLEDDNDYGGQKPMRTFHGRKYQNGYSDHLPIGLVLSY